MNTIFSVTEDLIERFKAVDVVNTIAFEKTSEMDLNKENIYPLVNIDIVNTSAITDVMEVNYVITILQQRDWDNQLNNDKLLVKDNLIDNLSETHSIATEVLNSYNQEDYYTEHSEIQFLKFVDSSNLDGVRFNFSIEIETNLPCN